MNTITITLPDIVLKVLKGVSESEGGTVEEFVCKAILTQLNISDPEAKAELHLRLSEKYMSEAEGFLAKKDYVQASEKAWGAASQIVKAIAAMEGKELRSHGELHKFVAQVSEKVGDKDLGRLWRSATSLHQNFYENWFTESQVADGVEDVKTLIAKLKKLIAKG
jgi:uncharacterized protein (UPF0332 family)